MGDHSWEQDKNSVRFVSGAVIIAVLLLPHLRPEMFGWLIGFVPLPIFVTLTFLGTRQAITQVGFYILIGGGLAALLGIFRPFLFSLTLAPVGFLLAEDARRLKSPLQTGLRGVLILAGAWLLFWTAIGIIGRFNPYAGLLTGLDEGLTAAYDMYREAAGVPDADLLRVETTFRFLRQNLPQVLPAMLSAGVLFTVWANMALGNWLLRKIRPEGPVWRSFSEWQLPYQLVWGFIGAAAGTLVLPGRLKLFSLNLLIALTAVFFLQGLAVLVRLLLRFRTPRLLRVVIYLFLMIQGYGIILLSFLGLADIWADFRKLNPGHGSDTPPIPPEGG